MWATGWGLFPGETAPHGPPSPGRPGGFSVHSDRGKGLLGGTLNLEDVGSDPGWPLSPGLELSLLTWVPFSKVGEPGPGPHRPDQCPCGQGLAGLWLRPTPVFSGPN